MGGYKWRYLIVLIMNLKSIKSILTHIHTPILITKFNDSQLISFLSSPKKFRSSIFAIPPNPYAGKNLNILNDNEFKYTLPS